MLDISAYFPITNPTLIFLVVLLVILVSPVVMGKLRIPHIIGMVLAGVALGEYGFNILDRDDSFELFGRVGLYYIMFLASLELDTESIRRRGGHMAGYGLLTFAIPFVLTIVVSLGPLGYSPQASLLLGCIMASNTLVAYPIVVRHGLQRKPAVALSVGATMIALLLSLVLTAAIVAANGGGCGVAFWALFAFKLAAYCAVVMLVVPRLTRYFLRRYSDAVMHFIFVMVMLFLCAALSEATGIEGIFGAFTAGLILNRYIPRVSPLMNRIEFIGNALFIPYFLIGVGMLINVRLLFAGGAIVWVVAAIVFFGTAGKALAAYLSCFVARLPWSSGHMMFGLTSAHAAGAIAMVMVGLRLKGSDGQPLVSDDMLNGVVIMILFTCIISSIVTQRAAQTIVVRDQDVARDDGGDDERILVPMRYPEYADRLVNLAIMMRNPALGREIIGLNVVYDDTHAHANQERSRRLLEEMAKYAAAADVRMQTQVRVSENIANGIKHAFREFHASEIIIGMHMHREVSPKFWGEFHQSLFNGLNSQITMARIKQPLSTVRRIHVAIPSRAQFEQGFYRWAERVARLAENMDCRTVFHGRSDTLALLEEWGARTHPSMKVAYEDMEHWNGLPSLIHDVADDHLLIIVTARKGTISFKNALERLPEELTHSIGEKSFLIIFPEQHGDAMDEMTFAQPQHTEENSTYEEISKWLGRLRRRVPYKEMEDKNDRDTRH